MLAASVSAIAIHCAAKSVGPSSLQRGGSAGVVCLLNAFRDHCRVADYTLSSFGVDTIHSEIFSTELRAGGCTIVVTESFRVVPQPQRATGHHTCTRVRKTSSDIVAGRCTPRATISLTKLG
jgi:hypothetical protein